MFVEKIKLNEFQFKFSHRIIITKKELFHPGIKQDSDSAYTVEKMRSITHLSSAILHNLSRKMYSIGRSLRMTPPYSPQ